SPIPSRFSFVMGSMYSARMRNGLAAVLARNFGSSCGAFGACCGFGFPNFADILLPPYPIHTISTRTFIVGSPAHRGNAGAPTCVELSTLHWSTLDSRSCWRVWRARCNDSHGDSVGRWGDGSSLRVPVRHRSPGP